ncbi:hypothetical protein RUM44_009216 [Polyplax serrata]|uniref:Uncharacterized protein n=1 Tax=Polyplax serrata TaxID=468196 RepID=A0ABR1AS21_POLSC
MVEMINSLEDLCRLCAGKIDILMGINIFSSDNRQIFKKICVCLPIQISVDDSFPKMVCVECACKLDLMFDFRERSILTAHLFSDMMTVNSSSIINVDQNIPIEDHNVPGDFNNDFISCKLDNVKYTSELPPEICQSGSENLIHSENNITLEDSTDLITKAKLQCETRLKKSYDGIQYKENKESIKIKSGLQLGNTSSSVSKLYLHSGNETLEDDLKTENLRSTNLEISSLSTSMTDQNLTECTELDWFFCNICNKTFAEKEEFDFHNKQHLPNKLEKKSCTETEAQSSEVPPNKKKKTKQKKTIKSKGGEKKAESKVCTECGKQYKTNYKLQEHMRKHSGEKPFLCSYQDCKKTFRSKIGLAQHEANHSGQFEFSCSTCGKGFQCKSYLVVHQRVHSDIKPYVCKQCSRRFKTKQSLLDHMNRHLGVKPFLCDICGRGFITKGLCKAHQKVHSGTDNRRYPCNVCRKLFVSKSYLNTHFRIHTGEKPFICEVCGKGFVTRVDLRIHSTLHTGEKSFVCEMCGKAFARRDALRCHRRCHTGERPYKCEFCGQRFTQFSPMAIHKRLHTGERPYECDVCNKTFVSRSTMISHRKKHHATNNTTDSQSQPQSQFQFVAVDVQPEGLASHVEQSPQQLVVIDNSSQVLLALSKRQAPGESSPEVLTLGKLKNETSGVTVE